jgi:hypothetical protein
VNLVENVTDQCFALLYIFLFKQELSVEVREVDCIQVQKRYVSESGKDDVFYYEKNKKLKQLKNRSCKLKKKTHTIRILYHQLPLGALWYLAIEHVTVDPKQPWHARFCTLVQTSWPPYFSSNSTILE